ncbi:MAG: hypothetical protein Q9227_003354 [Pyrenula ochraceoflavens]
MAFSLIQFVLILAFAKIVSSQLAGIDNVTTAQGSNGHPQCSIGNITSVALGVANVTSQKFSPSESLTWTVALSSSSDPKNQSQLLYDRNYIFGSPPSTDLAKSPLQACALFFESLTTLLSFPGSNSDLSKGTCTDILPRSCVDDIIKTAQSEGLNLHSRETLNNTTSSSICANLQHRVATSPPASCNNLPKSAWENIIARGKSSCPSTQSSLIAMITKTELTGPTVPPPLQETGGCHPSTGPSFTLSLIQSTRFISAPNYDLIMPFVSGVTPVLTAVFGSSSNRSSNDAADVQLTCLKPLTSQAGETDDVAGKTHGSAGSKVLAGRANSVVAWVGLAALWMLGGSVL